MVQRRQVRCNQSPRVELLPNLVAKRYLGTGKLLFESRLEMRMRLPIHRAPGQLSEWECDFLCLAPIRHFFLLLASPGGRIRCRGIKIDNVA